MQFEAVSDALPRIVVPVEMMSEGLPRLLSWDVQAAPHENFGILRFAAGQLQTSRGVSDVQLAALIDIAGQRVVTVVLDKVAGKDDSKATAWTFEDRRITVASVDGVTEEFPLEGSANMGALAGAAAGAAAGTRRLSTGTGTGTAWAPWNDPVSGPFAAGGQPQPRPARTVQKKKKPKNIFELLFN
jgi:hypothetical protein